MLLWLEKHPCKTKSKFQDAPVARAARKADAIREARTATEARLGQNSQCSQKSQIRPVAA